MRFAQKLSALFLAGAVSSVFMTGCVENRSSLFIYGNLQVTGGDEATCEYDVSETAALWSRGTWDLATGNGYSGYFLVGSQLQAVGDPDTLKSETNRIQIEGVEVNVETISGPAPDVASFTQPASGMVDASSGSSPALAVVPINLGAPDNGFGVDSANGTGQYVFNIKVFGRTLGGIEVESGEVGYTVYTCEGCLARCSSESELITPPCNAVGSDYPYDCRIFGDSFTAGQCADCSAP